MSQNLSRRIGAAVIAAGITFVPVATSLGIAPAVAADAGTRTQAQEYDASHAITFTIHKYLQTGNQTPGAINKGGQELETAPDGSPLEGISYTINKITGVADSKDSSFPGFTRADGVDVATLKGQKNLNAIAAVIKTDPSKVADLTLSSKTIEGTTGANGQVSFDNAALDGHGAYLVVESDTAGAKVGGQAVNGSIVKANPFVAFMPITASGDNANATYNYDVHAYPKNTSVEAVKTFTNLSEIPQVGQQLNYAISADIPGFDKAQGQGLKKYVFEDTLPSQLGLMQNPTSDAAKFAVRLTASDQDMPTGTSPADRRVPNASSHEAFTGDLADREVLVADDDYTIAFDGQKVTVTLTPAGLTKMETFKTAHPLGKAQLFVPTVVKGAIADGSTKNAATITFNNGSGGGDVTGGEGPGDPGDGPGGDTTTTTETPPGPIFGKVKITKQNEEGTALEGAEFEMRWCTADGALATDDGRTDPIKTIALDKDVTEADYTNTDAVKDLWVTNQDGVIEWQGLQLLVTSSDTQENGENIDIQAVNNEGGKYKYCLHELKAPDGYEKHKEPILLEFARENKDSLVGSLTLEQDVLNIKRSDFSLPGTGGEGVLLYGAAGIALGGLGAGAAAMWMAGRKKRAASEVK